MTLLEDVYLNVPVTIDDLQQGKEWPHTRVRARQERFELQRRVARGDYTMVITEAEERTVSINRVGAFNDVGSALLLTTDPGQNWTDYKAKAALQNMLDTGYRDMMKHGRCILMNIGGELMTMPIEDAFPIGDSDSWAFVRPRVTTKSETGRPDVVQVMVWENGSLHGVVREFESVTRAHGNFGKVVADMPTVPAMLAYVDNPPVVDGWGVPFNDQLIPVATEMTRRDSGISYVLDKNESPTFAVYVNSADIQTDRHLIDQDYDHAPGDTPTVVDLQELAKAIRNGEPHVFPDGVVSAEFITWDSNMDASFQYKDELMEMWQDITGVGTSSPGDSASVPSGIAEARRSHKFVMRMARVHSLLYNEAQTIVPQPFEWEFIGDQMVGDDIDEGDEESVI